MTDTVVIDISEEQAVIDADAGDVVLAIEAVSEIITEQIEGPAGQDGADGVGVPIGGTTGQVLKKQSATDFDTDWDNEGGGPGSSEWGDITGTLSDQTDLQSALDAKEPANANIQTHIASASNPHAVTAVQAGADPAGSASAAYAQAASDLAGHEAAADPHSQYLTAAEGGAAYESKNANIQTHIASTSNPHAVTAAQATVTPGGNLAATDAQAGLDELQGDVDGINTALAGKQPLDALLTAIAALTTAANKFSYFDGVDSVALADLTAAGRALIDDADNTAQRATLGLAALSLKATIDSAALLDSNVVTTDKILDSNVTLAKLANLAANKLIGSLAGGVPEELTFSEAPDASTIVKRNSASEVIATAISGVASNGARIGFFTSTIADDATDNYTMKLNLGSFTICLGSGNDWCVLIGLSGTGLEVVHQHATLVSVGTAGTNPDVDGDTNYWKSATGILSIKNRRGSPVRYAIFEFSP